MALIIETTGEEVGLAIGGFSIAKTDPRSGRRLDESQDHGLATVHGKRLLLVLADGASGALLGGVAARRVVEFILDTFHAGVAEASGLLAQACQHVFRLNRQYMESQGTAALAYQCTCVVGVLDRSARFTWAAVGDSTMVLAGKTSTEHLTAEAEVLAARHLHRVGLPLESIRLCHGEAWIQPGQVLLLHSDGFRECADECEGLTLEQAKRQIERLVLTDDVTLMRVTPRGSVIASTAGVWDELEAKLGLQDEAGRRIIDPELQGGPES
jgi:serine/threonine protein phosphatase PrpC